MLLRLRVGSWTSVFVLLTALGVEAQTVTPAFPLATPVIGRVGDTQQRAVVAGVGSTAFAAWADRRDGRSTDLYGTRVTTAGVVLDAPSAPLVRGSGEQTWPALAASPSRLLLAYLDDAVGGCAPEVMALPLTLTGQPGLR